MPVIHLASIHEGKHKIILIDLGTRKFTGQKLFKYGGHLET
jgi:hypothetical protein